MTIAVAAIVALAYAGAAAAGSALALRWYGNVAPFADGPRPVRVRPWIGSLVAAIAGASLAARGVAAAELIALGSVAAALAACAATDLRCGLVPDAFTLVPLAVVLALAVTRGDLGPLFASVLVAAPFAAAAAWSGGRGMGWGDVKLAALAGALLGIGGALGALLLASLGAVALRRFHGERDRPIPFAPYVAGGIAGVVATTFVH